VLAITDSGLEPETTVSTPSAMLGIRPSCETVPSSSQIFLGHSGVLHKIKRFEQEVFRINDPVFAALLGEIIAECARRDRKLHAPTEIAIEYASGWRIETKDLDAT